MHLVFISESFALNGYIFVALTNKKLLLPLQCRLYTNLFPDCVKLIEYLASGVNVVSFNRCVGPSPRTKIDLYLLSICTYNLILAPKMLIFLSSYHKLMKILKDNQILCRSCYICIYLGQHFQLALQFLIQNYLT